MFGEYAATEVKIIIYSGGRTERRVKNNRVCKVCMVKPSAPQNGAYTSSAMQVRSQSCHDPVFSNVPVG